MKQFAIALTFALALTACREERQQTAADPMGGAPVEATAQLTPEELGALGAAIRKEPARAEQLLAAKNLSAESFEVQIRKVTESPDASKRYAAAFKQAQGRTQ